MHYSPTREEVFEAARAAISIFTSHGFSCCIVGGLGCTLFGNGRTPNDVDLVVLNTICDQESLKYILTDHPGSRFYSVPAKTIGATYRVLWYRVSEYYRYRSCKVDILQPGIMNIPSIPSEHIISIDGLPVMPLIPLIILKLQAWEDHRDATKSYLNSKQHTDAADLARLLPIAIRRGDNVRRESWLPQTFVEAARRRLKRYLGHFPAQAQEWKQIGLTVEAGHFAPEQRTRRGPETGLEIAFDKLRL
ncbi:hypothetical protein PsYK624_092100 [Phanerochaete sordida]|uniref:Uncharacterized protein n=1 Tax=Phanerochaete sordida TaxID=48140 RepID=A0A9P3GDS2_9APHY|nr:hypothetical protein PsYK624_092100 [Phanerochaete sordida]